MSRPFLLLFALIAGCTSGARADLEYIKKARSLAAEWSLINEQAAAGRLTPTYVASMHRWLRGDLQSAYSSLTQPSSAYSREMKALLAEPPDAPPGRLRTHADALKRIEDKLESA